MSETKSAFDIKYNSKKATGDLAIKVDNISKVYPLYHSHRDRLKEALHPMRKKYHHDFYALQNISFEVYKGETVGIIGQNGSGKSTLLSIVTGVLQPSSGGVLVNGKVASLLELGTGFNPELTGFENIYFYGMIAGFTREEMDKKIDTITNFADIGEFIYQPVKIYSSGMFVRLAFACAISVDPEILIIDEALAVGDMNFQAKCFRRFLELREKGTTILLVTHDVGSVINLCSRAMVLHRGVLVATGLPKKMADEYRRRCAEEVSKNKNLSISAISSSEHDFSKDGIVWQTPSPNTQEYGDGGVRIENFTLINSQGLTTTKFNSGENVSLLIKLRFYQNCAAPIVGFGIRDLAGQDLCGTNTSYEREEIGFVENSKVINVNYKFAIQLQRGIYNLTIACTELEKEGLIVHHRLYDVLTFEVTSERSFIGKFNLNPMLNISYS